MLSVIDLGSVAPRYRVALEHVELTPDERAVAITTWQRRMRNEHVSARVFAALVPQFMRAGVHDDRLVELSAMVGEELEHARMCAGVVLALGGEPVADLGELDPVPEHPGVGPVEALLRNLVSVACLSETVAVAQISAERDQAGHPALAEVLTRILADEVGHARLGWRALDALVPTLTPEAKGRLEAYLEVAFASLIGHHAREGADPRSRPGPALEGVGVCDGALQHSVYRDAVATVIIPSLEAAGLAAERAWSRAVGATTSSHQPTTSRSPTS